MHIFVWAPSSVQDVIPGVSPIIICFSGHEPKDSLNRFREHFPRVAKSEYGTYSFVVGEDLFSCWEKQAFCVGKANWQAICEKAGVPSELKDDKDLDIVLRKLPVIMANNKLLVPKPLVAKPKDVPTRKDLYEDMLQKAKEHQPGNSGFKFL